MKIRICMAVIYWGMKFVIQKKIGNGSEENVQTPSLPLEILTSRIKEKKFIKNS